MSRHCVSQVTLGKKLNMDRSAVSLIMSGKRRLKLSEMMAIEDALGIPTGDLYKQAALWLKADESRTCC